MSHRGGRVLGFLLLGVVPTLAIQALSSAPRAGAQPDQLELGRDLYVANCSSCHGPGAAGGPQAPSLLGVGPAAVDFMVSTGRMPLADPADQPVRTDPKFSPDEISAIVVYVASLDPSGPTIPSVDPSSGDVATGRTVFASNCLACHGAAAQGANVGAGQLAPSLDAATPTQIGEAVRIGPGVMPPFGAETIDDEELDSLARYLLEIRSGQDPGGAGLGHVGPVAEGFVAVLAGLGMLVLVIRFTGTKR